LLKSKFILDIDIFVCVLFIYGFFLLLFFNDEPPETPFDFKDAFQ